MNLIRTVISTPKCLFLVPRCTIAMQQLSTTANYTSKYAHSVFNSWRDLVKNPTDWRDYREYKSIGSVKAKYPDFKHRINGAALWLNTAPNWVLALLEGLNVGKRSKEDSWKNLVENPNKWWDNRPTKTNVNTPDFVLKKTGEGLWLDSSPKWVLAMLEGLNVGKRHNEDSWKNLVESPSKWWDNRPIKTNVNATDFVHKETREGLWLDSAPKWVLAVLEGLNVGKWKKIDSWKNLVENPYKWWDNRPRKTSLKAPDFKHKKTHESLWLDHAPQWILKGPEGFNLGKRKKEDGWKNLVQNPDKWLDNRPRKTNVNTPDFIHMETNEGLWLSSSPKWVLSQLPCLKLNISS